jgi:putative tributyrin esterase
MALIQCRFMSKVLNMSTSMTVILPENIAIGTRVPTLFLLHGYSDDDSIWVRRTSIERYVDSMGIAVIMPQVHRSFYADMDKGLNYWTFLSEELPKVARSMFPLSEERTDNFVAGLSMGGYGAFKWALNKPEFFAAAASLSGALVMGPERTHAIAEPIVSDLNLIFGEHGFAETNNDILWLIKQANTNNGPQPLLYQCCGTEDFLYEENLIFRDACEKTSLSLTYEEGPGVHNWTYWDHRIQDVLAWLPIKRQA